MPAGILGELAFMIETAAPRKLGLFLEDMADGSYSLDCGEADFRRISALVERFQDLPLGFADASVVACAERNGGRVMTFDRRDFDVVAGEGRITVEP